MKILKYVKDFLSKVRFSTVRLLRSKEISESYLGRTFAIGLSAGIFFFLGQIAIVLVLWVILDRILKLRFNSLIAVLLTFISNPLTSPIIIYTFYMTGSAMLGSAAVSFSELTHKFGSIIDKWNWHDGLSIIFHGIGRPIILGSIPWHIVMALIGYWIGVKSHRRFLETVKHRNNGKAGKSSKK